ncbi:MAG: hypothetical protein Pg6A_08870 [Termitinemataceae bacterium]|nr:MAG: hypothetical protein Pg6A_08870 [Termitinemataceae bacterium]
MPRPGETARGFARLPVEAAEGGLQAALGIVASRGLRRAQAAGNNGCHTAGAVWQRSGRLSRKSAPRFSGCLSLPAPPSAAAPRSGAGTANPSAAGRYALQKRYALWQADSQAWVCFACKAYPRFHLTRPNAPACAKRRQRERRSGQSRNAVLRLFPAQKLRQFCCAQVIAVPNLSTPAETCGDGGCPGCCFVNAV